MTAPVRLQLSRKKGFDLQAWSREVNGLPAVNVARPSKWGNPYKVGPLDAETAVRLFRDIWHVALLGEHGEQRRAMLSELRGKNLACWCAPDAPCHADVLLELANR